tara:strand:- start:11034 stop:11264 length:231 start_codon:yes stop_codon:yes gene_type:complete
MNRIAAILVLLMLSACTTPLPDVLLRECKDWPVAGAGDLDVKKILTLTQDGKLAHADCQARYDALRAYIEANQVKP